jgi:hypothetical protein
VYFFFIFLFFSLCSFLLISLLFDSSFFVTLYHLFLHIFFLFPLSSFYISFSLSRSLSRSLSLSLSLIFSLIFSLSFSLSSPKADFLVLEDDSGRLALGGKIIMDLAPSAVTGIYRVFCTLIVLYKFKVLSFVVSQLPVLFSSFFPSSFLCVFSSPLPLLFYLSPCLLPLPFSSLLSFLFFSILFFFFFFLSLLFSSPHFLLIPP